MNNRSSLLVVSAALFTLVLFLTVPNLYGAWGSFRCGTKLVQIGDTKADVMSKCGQPTTQTEGRIGEIDALPGASEGVLHGDLFRREGDVPEFEVGDGTIEIRGTII